MTVLVDTSVVIDYLRGLEGAATILEAARIQAPLHASEITRAEVLTGMRKREESATRSFLSTLVWHPVDEPVAERAGELGRQWIGSHNSIDSADLVIAATAQLNECELLTCNVKHFPMFKKLKKPY